MVVYCCWWYGSVRVDDDETDNSEAVFECHQKKKGIDERGVSFLTLRNMMARNCSRVWKKGERKGESDRVVGATSTHLLRAKRATRRS